MPHPWESSWRDAGKLSSGGQGVTRLVTSSNDPNNKGVLKYLKNNASPAARGRMRREVASMQSLLPLGASVPRVLEHNMAAVENLAAELFIVMEYIPGPTLNALVEANEKLPVDKSVEILLNVCKTIQIGHAESVLHRDIKPDNIIIKSESPLNVVVIDYGLSFNSDDVPLTETDETFRNKFMDLPEANTPGGDKRDKRSDITALCGLFYYMLTGHKPGQLSDSRGRHPHVRQGFSIRESLGNDQRLHEIELLFGRGFAIPIENRFQSIDELTVRLQSIASRGIVEADVNPFTTAAELSEQLLRQDRKTRVAVRREPAAAVIDHMVKKVRGMNDALKSFPAQFNQGGIELVMPGGADAVTNPYTLTLQVQNHNVSRSRVYRIGLRGDQCVMFASDVIKSLNGNSNELSEAKEVAWYETQTLDALAEIEREMKVWIDRKVREMFDEIMALR